MLIISAWNPFSVMDTFKMFGLSFIKKCGALAKVEALSAPGTTRVAYRKSTALCLFDLRRRIRGPGNSGEPLLLQRLRESSAGLPRNPSRTCWGLVHTQPFPGFVVNICEHSGLILVHIPANPPQSSNRYLEQQNQYFQGCFVFCIERVRFPVESPLSSSGTNSRRQTQSSAPSLFYCASNSNPAP